ncbi:MAG: DUF4115 domain-containing protein [Calditrichaeota bacterium]|jgi:hypothetical protein|nr:DUF4115 domain-containing protein [Calditrichota bacterium]MBT7790368.1 DUF4115 domain-containing protein [Calditrichota bacterium]
MNIDSKYPVRHSLYPEIGTPDIRRKIANELRSAREFNEMSLDQIRSVTKINTLYLENLETGNWAFLPAVYVNLFIKAYAQAVGVQSDEFSDRLNEVFESTEPAFRSVEISDYFGDNAQQPNLARAPGFFSWVEKNRSIIISGGITIVAVIVIAWYLVRPPQPDTIMVDAKPNISAIEDAKSNSESQIVDYSEEPDAIKMIESEEVDEVALETFKLGLLALGTCYVKVEDQDSILYDRTLWPGNIITNEYPDPVKLTLGNAPEMRLLVNGDTLDVLDPEKKVRVLRVGSNGIIE